MLTAILLTATVLSALSVALVARQPLPQKVRVRIRRGR
jgi:hypothetical protein